MSDPLETTLRSRFGLSAFRGIQREVLEHVMAGGDALVVMPTGAGKSLLYQLPALITGQPTLVLSPLIALMKDQVDALRERGIAATFINSSLDRRERERRLARYLEGGEDLLYVTPERFRVPGFAEQVVGRRVGLLAVDEAHCASEWGHDFRPQYSQIAEIRRALGEPPTIALTATATPRVQEEILRLVGIPGARVFHTGIERPNLFLGVTQWVHEEDKWDRVAALLDRLPGSGIVYGALIQDLHRLESRLARAGERSLLYHGGLSREERRQMQEEFMGGAHTRVLATGAFGMGVDKADIRFLLHHQVPGSVEAYTQEVGRAGRDGAPSYCELLYCEQDLPIQVQFVEWANPDAPMLRDVAAILEQWGEDVLQHDREDLHRALGLPPRRHDGRIDTCFAWLHVLGVLEGSFEQRDLRLLRPFTDADLPPVMRAGDKRERDLRRLWQLVEYVKSDECRRVWLEHYFGLPPSSGDCGACDRCVDREEWLRDRIPPSRDSRGASATHGLEDSRPADALRRGDFVRVDGGRFLGRVVRVGGEPGRERVEVECVHDLRVRRFQRPQRRVERIEGE